MVSERFDAIREELSEVQDLPELKALWCDGQANSSEYADACFVQQFKDAVAKLRLQKKEEPKVDVEDRVEQLMAEVEELRGTAVPQAPVPQVQRAGRKYVLLKAEVEWSTKPQVHALMAILCAHAKVGDELDEADIVRMMVANEGVLQTRQGGKRIWDYYKGDHAEGLVAHGNVRKL